MISLSLPASRAALVVAVAAGLTTLSLAPMASATPAPVVVTNLTTRPVPTFDTDNPAREPFQTSLLPHSSTSGSNATYFTVPAGKRLVIEYYSAQAQDLTGGASGLTLGTSVGGTWVSYIVYVNANNTNQLNQTTRIYADPGTSVQAFAFNGGGAHSCGALISISGYLINVAVP